jgi:hypothetical protein
MYVCVCLCVCVCVCVCVSVYCIPYILESNCVCVSVYCIPYILESNPHSDFGDFLNGKKLVRGSNPHLSFYRPLPTGRLIG